MKKKPIRTDYIPPEFPQTPVKDFFRYKFPRLFRLTVVVAWIAFVTTFWTKMELKNYAQREKANADTNAYHQATFFMEQLKFRMQFGSDI